MIEATSRKNGPPFSNIQTAVGLFIAHDPVSGWVSVGRYTEDAVQAASRYMPHALHEAQFHIHRVLQQETTTNLCSAIVL